MDTRKKQKQFLRQALKPKSNISSYEVKTILE